MNGARQQNKVGAKSKLGISSAVCQHVFKECDKKKKKKPFPPLADKSSTKPNNLKVVNIFS